VEEMDTFEEDLSPWYGDLAEDEPSSDVPMFDAPVPDVPAPDVPAPDSPQTGACPDVDGPASRTEELRSSLHVPPLLDEGVPVPSYGRRRRGRRLVRRDEKSSRFFTPEQRLLLPDKQGNPEFGCRRISDMLVRGPALPASPTAVARVLHEAGYVLEDVTTRPHRDRVRRFERAAITSYGTPEEILTDNGAQYVTWRGKSAFTKECEKRGIRQIVARPRRPQTPGKIGRFWGTLWRECLQTAVFTDLGDARTRIGHFLDYYNFQRTHTGVGGLVPADRFFGAAPEMLRTLKERVAARRCGGEVDASPAGVSIDGPLSGGVARDDTEPVGDGESDAAESAAPTEEEADDAVPTFLSDRVKRICESLRDAGDDEWDDEGGAK
jgi:hypothetical protein